MTVNVALRQNQTSPLTTAQMDANFQGLADVANALQLVDYTALRAYAGAAQGVYITGYLATSAPSGIAGLFVRDDHDTTSADDSATVIVAANGVRWKRAYAGRVNVQWFGAKGDGVTDDTVAIQAAINHGGKVHLIDNAVHKITSALTLDVSQAGLHGCGSVIDASLSANGALTVYSSAAYGAQRLERNWTHWIEGIAFEGNQTAGYDLITIGHATYLNSCEITFRHCGFRNAARLVVFIDNAWRCNFDHCGFESAIANYLYFNAAANAGEVMRFAHCWFVDGTNAYFYLNEGMWFFDNCSFPGGGTGGMQVLGSAHVVLRGCNLETQAAAASQYLIEGYNSSLIVLDGCLVSTNAGAANQALFSASDACALRIQNSTLPLYGTDLASEATEGVRVLVAGSSGYVNCRDNYVKGTGSTDRTKWAVFSRLCNLLRNGDAETGDTSGWTVSTYGTAGSTFTSATTSPKNGAHHFIINCVANGGISVTETISGASSFVGRTAVFGAWAQAIGGAGAVDYPTVRALDNTGAQIASYAVAVNSTDAAYTWVGGYLVIPPGTDKLVMEIGGQQQAAAHTIYYDDVIFNVI